jgi:hypothetical protein
MAVKKVGMRPTCHHIYEIVDGRRMSYVSVVDVGGEIAQEEPIDVPILPGDVMGFLADDQYIIVGAYRH